MYGYTGWNAIVITDATEEAVYLTSIVAMSHKSLCHGNIMMKKMAANATANFPA